MSDTDTRKPLNLDELFGEARAVKVIHDGKEYELLRLDAINPRQLQRFQAMQKKTFKLQKLGENMSEVQAGEVEKLFDEMLGVICKALPLTELAFVKKMRIITFYIEETQGKKALEAALQKATGARPSRS